MIYEQLYVCVEAFAFWEYCPCRSRVPAAFAVIYGCIFFYQLAAVNCTVREEQQGVIVSRNYEKQLFYFLHDRAAYIQEIISFHVSEFINQDFAVRCFKVFADIADP